jgi:HAD superfamily hydrolase (TIGR01509 family)
MKYEIKAIIFDLDGVLVETKDLHFEALNKAISKFDDNFIINYQDHLSIFDGMSTKEKLKILCEKGLRNEFVEKISLLKQEITNDLLNKYLTKNNELISLFEGLKDNGYLIAVATNSIKKSLFQILDKLELLKYIDFSISNEDVVMPKPHSEIYQKTFMHFGLNAKDCLIVEDSKIGREAAYKSGAFVYEIDNPKLDLKYNNILSYINYIHNKNMKWKSNNLNILIPMAGHGSRFREAGYTFPKPLITLRNKPMIQIVSENLALDAKFIFLVLKEHNEKYNLKSLLNLITNNNCEIVEVNGVTEGAACTSLLAKDLINNDESLIIANSDQFIVWDSFKTMYSLTSSNIDGGILTFKSTHPKWSFAKVDNNQYVQEVAEKNPISDNATVGIYYWKKGSDYVKYAEQMISNDIRVNNEFYICPVYNEAIKNKKKIIIKEIDEMWGLGTPEDLEEFKKSKHYNAL